MKLKGLGLSNYSSKFEHESAQNINVEKFLLEEINLKKISYFKLSFDMPFGKSDEYTEF